jgi:hypothetical protein
MTPDTIAEWFRWQGNRVVHTTSSFWVQVGPRVLQAIPYHWIIRPTEEELTELLHQERAVALRYSTPWEMSQGMASYHAVYEQRSYGFENLGRWARKNVRRGLKNCTIEPVPLELIAQDGWDLQVDTLNRQGRHFKLDRSSWERMGRAAGDLPGFDGWGAFVDGSLAASVITLQVDDCAYMLYQQCLRQFLPRHVNNALSFMVTQALLARPGVRTILYGLHSLDAPSSVDEFKFRMGYTAKPVRQRVVFHPMLRPFFNPTSHALLKHACSLRPGDPILAKTEGMLRFYLQGLRPLEQQDRPDALNIEHSVVNV